MYRAKFLPFRPEKAPWTYVVRFLEQNWKTRRGQVPFTREKYSGSLFLLSEPFQILARLCHFLDSSAKKQRIWKIQYMMVLEQSFFILQDLSDQSLVDLSHPVSRLQSWTHPGLAFVSSLQKVCYSIPQPASTFKLVPHHSKPMLGWGISFRDLLMLATKKSRN